MNVDIDTKKEFVELVGKPLTVVSSQNRFNTIYEFYRLRINPKLPAVCASCNTGNYINKFNAYFKQWSRELEKS